MERYGKLNGYRVTVSDRNFISGTDRYPAWNKVRFILSVLEEDNDSDWIVWIDDDIILTNPFIPLDWFIMDSHKNKSFIVQNDISQYKEEPTNTGIWFIRNFREEDRKTAVKAVLEQLWDYGETNKCPLWEQSAFNKMIVGDPQLSSIVGRLS